MSTVVGGLRLERGISEVFPTSVVLWHSGAAVHSGAPSSAAQCRVTQPHGQQRELLCSTSAQGERRSGGCQERSPCRGGGPRHMSPGSAPSLGSSAQKWPASARCGREKGEVGCAQGRARHARGSRRGTEPLPQLRFVDLRNLPLQLLRVLGKELELGAVALRVLPGVVVTNLSWGGQRW